MGRYIKDSNQPNKLKLIAGRLADALTLKNTLSLDEIKASTDTLLEDKIPKAKAIKDLNSSLSGLFKLIYLPSKNVTNSSGNYDISEYIPEGYTAISIAGITSIGAKDSNGNFGYHDWLSYYNLSVTNNNIYYGINTHTSSATFVEFSLSSIILLVVKSEFVVS